MHLSSAIILSLSIALTTAWEFKSNDNRLSGSGTRGCQLLDHPRGDKLKWYPSDGTSSGSRCCLYVYKREGCEGDSRGLCRDHNDNLEFHFRSFEINCDGRRTGGNQDSGSQYEEEEPSRAQPSNTYRPNQSPPRESNRPGQWEQNRPGQWEQNRPDRPSEPSYESDDFSPRADDNDSQGDISQDDLN
jgi:hypothetical protein